MKNSMLKLSALAACALFAAAAAAQPAPETPKDTTPPANAEHAQARAMGVKFYPSHAECQLPRSYYETLLRNGWQHRYGCRTPVGEPQFVRCHITDCDTLP